MASEFKLALKTLGGAAAKAELDGVGESLEELGHHYSHMNHRIHEIHHLLHAFGGFGGLGLGNLIGHEVHRNAGAAAGGGEGGAKETHPGFIANLATQALGLGASFIPYVGPAAATAIGVEHERIAGGIQEFMDHQKKSFSELYSVYGGGYETEKNGFKFDIYQNKYTDERTPRQMWQNQHPGRMFDPLDPANIFRNRYELEQAGIVPPETPTLGQQHLATRRTNQRWDPEFDWSVLLNNTKEVMRWLTEW